MRYSNVYITNSIETWARLTRAALSSKDEVEVRECATKAAHWASERRPSRAGHRPNGFAPVHGESGSLWFCKRCGAWKSRDHFESLDVLSAFAERKEG